ncbi:hypothetical protein FDI40_gp428 [Agrobacterium phage Atu_ph07]|uniref:Uncharacterized protein n=1 Tax=Agrobacterium phage Atu_ph07 TaxID=2024264 RepID=A0A2L0V077_9CAUD|nr:hypothetical protein FDI40_gp428 [Agrobacterium phage Atu_ph07]AUZ95187.1 hypothetical protein [Agrobacterium phage Atu_ph07]
MKTGDISATTGNKSLSLLLVNVLVLGNLSVFKKIVYSSSSY